MVFSSTLFLIYFLPAFLVAYHIVRPRFKNAVILIASILFYAWGAPKFVFLLLGSTILDFYLVKHMHSLVQVRSKQVFLALSIALNVGLLLYFKYANFFVENVNGVLHSLGIETVAWTAVALPIGISFYTFQTLTYSIDVYRKEHEPLDNLWNYLLYIMSFPQMIAGPIVKFNQVADQIVSRKEPHTDKLHGLFRFFVGLGKKVLIANVMGEYADTIMGAEASELTAGVAWVGILCYTFQIYFDFSGYSDMAIGLGKIMGFTFPENFNSPYTARSISEFWRRWHMTLGSWMREYLYIPLGGNRVKTQTRLFFNLWLVFLISGLWHGASWNFVFWGAFHGLFLILDRLFLLKILDKMGKVPSVLFTFLVVMIGWVFFRIETFAGAMDYIETLFGLGSVKEVLPLDFKPRFFAVFALAIIISFAVLTKYGQKWCDRIYSDYRLITNKKTIGYTLSIFVLLVICISEITTANFNPFIYFRF